MPNDKCKPNHHCKDEAYLSAYSCKTQPIKEECVPKKICFENTCLQKNIVLTKYGCIIVKKGGIYYTKLCLQLKKRCKPCKRNSHCNCHCDCGCKCSCPTLVRLYAVVNGENTLCVSKCLNLECNHTTPVELSGLLHLKPCDKVKFVIISNSDEVELQKCYGCGCEPPIPSATLTMFKVFKY